MERSEETRSSVGNGGPRKTIHRQKPHRKLVSGLKLFKTSVSANTSDTSTDPWRQRRLRVSDDENNEVSEPQQDLPSDLITHEILTRLPIKSLLQFKSVSKEWYSTISSYAFSNAQFKASLSNYTPASPIECIFIQAENNYYLLFYNEEEDGDLLDYSLVKLEIDFGDPHQNEIQLVGSSNGLVCLAYSSPVSSHVYISNPITHHWCKFPDPYISSFNNYRTSWGFGYVSSEDDYKVVRLIQDYTTLELIVHIFSLRTQEWKRVQDHGLDHTVSLAKSNPGVLVEETLFWIMDTRGPMVVVGFSLAREKFEKIPDLQPRSAIPWNQCLCEMAGCLGMQDEVGLSILKKPGEVESISLSSDLGPRLGSGLVGSTRAGRFFVVSKNWELALIDPSMSPTQYTPLITFKKDGRTSIIRYVPSLISPFSISELHKDC